MEMGIDWLYPKPKSNFLPFGNTKNLQKQEKAKEKVEYLGFWDAGGDL